MSPAFSFVSGFYPEKFGKLVFLEYSLFQEDTAMDTIFYHFAAFDVVILGAIALLVACSFYGKGEA